MTLFGKTKPQARLNSPNIFFLKKPLSGIYARRKGVWRAGGWGGLGVENRRQKNWLNKLQKGMWTLLTLRKENAENVLARTPTLPLV